MLISKTSKKTSCLKGICMRKWIDKLKMSLNRLMYGRNGQDEFGTAAYLTGTVVYFVSVIFKNRIMICAGGLLFCYGVFRMFSRNIWKRQRENSAFLDLMRRPGKYVTLFKLSWEYRHTHRYYICRNCGQIIRVPKGKRKIEITCTRCGHKFIRRT